MPAHGGETYLITQNISNTHTNNYSNLWKNKKYKKKKSIDHGMFNPNPSPRNVVYKVVHVRQNQVRINTFCVVFVETAIMVQAVGHFVL